jgi:hypothetical protein
MTASIEAIRMRVAQPKRKYRSARSSIEFCYRRHTARETFASSEEPRRGVRATVNPSR